MSETQLNCLNCGQSEMEIPLLSARYAGEQLWSFFTELDTLTVLVAVVWAYFKGADKIPPSPHSH